jgi:hypothetical protein
MHFTFLRNIAKINDKAPSLKITGLSSEVQVQRSQRNGKGQRSEVKDGDVGVIGIRHVYKHFPYNC